MENALAFVRSYMSRSKFVCAECCATVGLQVSGVNRNLVPLTIAPLGAPKSRISVHLGGDAGKSGDLTLRSDGVLGRRFGRYKVNNITHSLPTTDLDIGVLAVSAGLGAITNAPFQGRCS
jgi:hypothetical protein